MFEALGESRRVEAAPLAEVLRPRKLSEVVGQEHLTGDGGALARMVGAKKLHSMILWGPPGSGKTTLARIIAAEAGYELESLTAAGGGVKDVREAIERAKERWGTQGRASAVFIDEVHRFSKSQQDLLLGATETGEITLIGATTENPYFEVNAALMSRTTLWRLKALDEVALRTLLERGAQLRGAEVDEEAYEALVASSDGDARVALGSLDTAIILGSGRVGIEDVRQARDGRIYHQGADSHYDQVSAFIKSVRGSDPDAAMMWMVVLLEAGEDPRFLVRRLVILAAEDVGLADPMALVVAEAAGRAVDRVGLPEARLHLAEATLYLALAPKSNSATTALAAAEGAVRSAVRISVPVALRDNHYAGAKKEGHGEGYVYPHGHPGSYVEQAYAPEELQSVKVYEEGELGREKGIVEAWNKRKQEE